MSTKSAKRKPGTGKGGVTWSTLLVIIIAVAGIIALGLLLFLNLAEPEAIEGLSRSIGLSRGHDESVDYDDVGLPPTGGVHSGVWQNCGIYAEPILAKNAVHSMEHGAVWITYNPDLPDEDIEELRDSARGESYVLMSPFPGLKSPVVLTAWGIQLELESAADERVSDFIDRYQLGPQTPERGASCINGTGEPVG